MASRPPLALVRTVGMCRALPWDQGTFCQLRSFPPGQHESSSFPHPSALPLPTDPPPYSLYPYTHVGTTPLAPSLPGGMGASARPCVPGITLCQAPLYFQQQRHISPGPYAPTNSLAAAGASEAESVSAPTSSPSWWGKLKGMIWKDPATDKPVGPSNDVAAALQAFASQLDEAQRFGQLAQFGKGLPRGGEGAVTASLKQQQEIARALAGILPSSAAALREDGSVPAIPKDVKAATAARVGCTAVDVENFLGKFNWFCRASKKMSELKEQGKPMPKSFSEMEEMMGGRWNRQQHGTTASTTPPSRNSLCPCGSGKKYKRCCAANN